jgi:116 kDa U5 small nuclear ribonucleoprotein component
MNRKYDRFGNKKKLNGKENISKSGNSIERSWEKLKTKENCIPRSIYSKEILIKKILRSNNNSKTISVTGHLHHGKSTLIEVLASSVHLINNKFLLGTFSNLFFLEQEKGLTLYPNVITLNLHFKKKKSAIFNLIDCPGHPDFQDQNIACLQISDGIILMVDLLEGMMIGTEISLKNAINRGLPLVLILNALDRLIIELNLSPKEIHFRLLTILDEINYMIQKILKISDKNEKNHFKYFNPLLNNVCFSSLIQGWTFTIEQFSEIYLSSQPSCCLSIKELGCIIWNGLTIEKVIRNQTVDSPFTEKFLFQELILYPIFKLIFLNLTENYSYIRKFMEVELGIFGIKMKELSLFPEKIVNLCVLLFLGGSREVKLMYNHSGMINCLVYHLSCRNKNKSLSIKKNRKTIKNELIGYISNFFPEKKTNEAIALCKIFDGKLKTGDKIQVLTDEPFYYKNQKCISVCKIIHLRISIGRYMIKIFIATKGNIVFIKGLENNCKKNGIFIGFNVSFSDLIFFFSSIKRNLINSKVRKIVKISIKPIKIKDIENIIKVFRFLSKIYPNLNCQVDSYGNIIISSTSLFYLECVLRNFKNSLDGEKFQISDPYIFLRETISKIKNFDYDIGKSLILNIKRSRLRYFSNFSIFGFLKIYDKIILNGEEPLFLLYPLTGGYISQKLIEKTVFSKIESNSLWFFYFDSINSETTFLKGSSTLYVSDKEKREISNEFKGFLRKGKISTASLNGLELELKQRYDCVFDFNLSLLKRKKEKIQKDFYNLNSLVQQPIFLIELVFPENYFSIIMKYLRKKKTHITSFESFLGKKIISIRAKLVGNMFIKFEQDIPLLTQGECYIFFLFDFWENIS